MTRRFREIITVPAILLALSGAASLANPSIAEARAPYTDSELRSQETADEAKVREIRDQEVTQLKIALSRRQPANRMADLYLRLAEIYLESYRAEYLLEGRAHEKRLEQRIEDKNIDHSHSRPYLVNGIKACKEILDFNIPYSKLDQVYYFLGFNYGELGERQESLKYLEKLSREFPDSVFVAEAHREMGDSAFYAADYRRAISQYELAVKKSRPEEQARLLHKLAWSYYRIKQYDRAVDAMKQAIASTQKHGERYVSLREEALRDMAIFMTETGRVEEAITYFQSVAADKTFYPKLLEKLGRQYERNVEPGRATQVYESLLKTHPDSDGAIRALAKLVDLDLRRGRVKEALARLVEIPSTKPSDSETQAAFQNLRAMVRRTATEHHEKYRKKHERAALEIAESYYAVYLKSFLEKDDPRQETPEIQMYLAEVKRDLGKSKEASELYRKVVDSRDKRYAKEAGALWTASLSEAVKKSDHGNAPGGGPAKEPNETEKEFIAAADAMQDSLGDTAEGREAALRAAEVLAGYKDTQKDAIKRIRKLIARAPKSLQAVTGARLWIQLVSDRLPAIGQVSRDQGDVVDELKDVLKELRENPVLLTADQEQAKGKLKALMAEQETRLKVFAIADSEREKDYVAAAKGYEAFAKDSPQRDIAEKSFASALANYQRAGDVESVDRVSNAWFKRFPKSGKAIESLRGTATHELISGKFDRSAQLFQLLGTEGGDADSLETAGRIVHGMGDAVRARQIFEQYLATYKTPQRWPVALTLARLLEESKQDGEAAKVYRDCMSGPAEFEAECGSRLADLYLSIQNVAEAKSLYQKVANPSSKKVVSPFVGYARFKLASFMEDEAKFNPLQLPEAQLKAAMNQRLAFLEPLSKAYQSAVEAGGPWAVAALDRQAHWVARFADEMDAIPTPEGADATAVANFRKSLSNVSGPLRKRAIQTWNDAYSKCLATEVLSPVLPEIADRLVQLKSGGIARAQGFRGRFRLAGLAADGGSEGRGSLEKVREKLVKNPQDAAAWVDYGNLLWGSGKPLLSKLAYDRALGLNRKFAPALNNRAVIELTAGSGEEDWLASAHAMELLDSAIKQDEFFVPAKVNKALLLNYYRLFAKAKPLWEQIAAKSSGADLQDGLAISLQGLGQAQSAEDAFKKARELGAPASRFSQVYHEAARVSLTNAESAARCESLASALDGAALVGFEKASAQRLKEACSQWNK